MHLDHGHDAVHNEHHIAVGVIMRSHASRSNFDVHQAMDALERATDAEKQTRCTQVWITKTMP